MDTEGSGITDFIGKYKLSHYYYIITVIITITTKPTLPKVTIGRQRNTML